MKRFLGFIQIVLGYIVMITVLVGLAMLCPTVTCIVISCWFLAALCETIKLNWDKLKERFTHGVRGIK